MHVGVRAAATTCIQLLASNDTYSLTAPRREFDAGARVAHQSVGRGATRDDKRSLFGIASELHQ